MTPSVGEVDLSQATREPKGRVRGLLNHIYFSSLIVVNTTHVFYGVLIDE